MALTPSYRENHGGVRPLARIAGGLAVVYCAFRVNGFDLLMNPVGWAMCAGPLDRLRRTAHDPFDRARTFVLAMVCVSVVAVFAAGVRPSLGPAASPAVELIVLADGVGGMAAVWLIADAVVRRLRTGGHASRAAVLDVLRWAATGFGLLATVAGHGYATLGFVVVIAWFGSLAALVVLLYRSADLVSAPASTG